MNDFAGPVRKALRQVGASFLRQGRGDHEVWTSPHSSRHTANGILRDRREAIGGQEPKRQRKASEQAAKSVGASGGALREGAASVHPTHHMQLRPPHQLVDLLSRPSLPVRDPVHGLGQFRQRVREAHQPLLDQLQAPIEILAS